MDKMNNEESLLLNKRISNALNVIRAVLFISFSFITINGVITYRKEKLKEWLDANKTNKKDIIRIENILYENLVVIWIVFIYWMIFIFSVQIILNFIIYLLSYKPVCPESARSGENLNRNLSSVIRNMFQIFITDLILFMMIFVISLIITLILYMYIRYLKGGFNSSKNIENFYELYKISMMVVLFVCYVYIKGGDTNKI
jgi:magnesium-transporting ATPase (P-type)